MCLTTQSTPKLRIIPKDIISYKMLIRYDGVLKSPFYNFEYELDKLYNSKISYSIYMHNSVLDAFHSNKYNNIQECDKAYLKEYLERRLGINNIEIVIVECIIPKGSEVIDGYWEEDELTKTYDGYASNKIIINKIITDDEV